MKVFLRDKLVFCLFCLIAAAVSHAQTAGSGRIGGTVTDPFGAVVPGRTVRVRANDGKSETEKAPAREATTDSSGRYAVEGLAPGEYTVNIDFDGMVYKNAEVKVAASETTTLNATVTYEANCESEPGASMPTDDDRAWMVNDMLARALNDGIADRGLLLKQEGPIVVSSENIKAEWVKPFSKFKFALLSAKEVQTLADAYGDFLYLSFHNWKLQPGCAVVTLSNGWAVGKRSEMAYLSGGGAIFLYRKKGGKWEVKPLFAWIS